MMKVNVSYTSRKHFDRTNIMQWVWTWRPYRDVRGVIFRVCGVYFNVREKHATEKLMRLATGVKDDVVRY